MQKFKSIFYYGRKVIEKLINFSCSEIEKIIKSNFVKKKINIIIFGAAFKCYPRTNDIRFSAAINVVNHIKKKFKNCSIEIFDNFVSKKQISDVGCKKINSLNNKKNVDILIINSIYIKTDKVILKKFLNQTNKNLIVYSFWFLKELKGYIGQKQRLFTLVN